MDVIWQRAKGKGLSVLMGACLTLASAGSVAAGPGLMIDDQAPDFEATTYEGDTVKLSELYAEGPVVLVFYRGVWCPYCNRHLQEIQAHLPAIEKAGAQVLAVSVDKLEFAKKSVEENQLGFEVITDPEAAILADYNLLYTVPEDLAKKYLDEYAIDLQMHSGRTDHVIAVPATFIIDETGKIIFADINEDYKVRTNPAEVVDVLRSLK